MSIATLYKSLKECPNNSGYGKVSIGYELLAIYKK